MLQVLGKIQGRDPSVLDSNPKHCFQLHCTGTSGKVSLHRIQLFKTSTDVLIFLKASSPDPVREENIVFRSW